MESAGRGLVVYSLVCQVLTIVLDKVSVRDQVVGSARSTDRLAFVATRAAYGISKLCSPA